MSPLISVVMPVHNAMPHLDEAVRSILAQSHADFEFVVVDDASSDGTSEVLQQWARRDSRIRLFREERNLGLAGSANRVVALSSAPLIARMDADDRSLPDRLEREVALLEARPDVGLVASLCDVMDSAGRHLRGPDYWRLARTSWFPPFPHGSIMFRREVFDAVGGYRAECEYWEDLDFVLRVSERSKIVVLPKALYCYRQSDTSARIASDQEERIEQAMDLRYRSIERIGEEGGYEDLLRAEEVDRVGRVDPRVFISLGALVLWSNQRPRLVRRLFRRGKLGFDMATAMALVWTTWASPSPSTLRVALQLFSRVRNRGSKKKIRPGEPVEWVTPAKAEPSA